MTLRKGDKVVVKILDPATQKDECRQLYLDGWRVVGFQSDGTVILLQPRDPDELH
jgi:hypothetical protein